MIKDRVRLTIALFDAPQRWEKTMRRAYLRHEFPRMTMEALAAIEGVSRVSFWNSIDKHKSMLINREYKKIWTDKTTPATKVGSI